MDIGAADLVPAGKSAVIQNLVSTYLQIAAFAARAVLT